MNYYSKNYYFEFLVKIYMNSKNFFGILYKRFWIRKLSENKIVEH